MQKIRIIGFFFENRLRWHFEVEKISTNGCVKQHFYLPIYKTFIHNFLYVFDNWGKNLSQKDIVKLQLENIYPKDQADPDNQRPDKWCSTVQ
jgi:hypothetical protein